MKFMEIAGDLAPAISILLFFKNLLQIMKNGYLQNFYAICQQIKRNVLSHRV